MDLAVGEHDQPTSVLNYVQHAWGETSPRRSVEEPYHVSDSSEDDRSREDYYVSRKLENDSGTEARFRGRRDWDHFFDTPPLSQIDDQSQGSTDECLHRTQWERDLCDVHVGGSSSQSTASSVGAIEHSAPCDSVLTSMGWLSSIDHNRHQEETLRDYCPGSGQWIFSSEEFQNWLKREKQTLFCPGIPGAGKTMAAALVVDHLQKQFIKDNVGIAYVYGRPYDYTYNISHIFRSLLKQLALCLPTVPDAVRSLYRHQKNREQGPRIAKVCSALDSVMGQFSRVFIVIDALDELPLSSRLLELILSEIRSWQSRYNLNLLVTSRTIPSMTQYFHDEPTVEIRADREDLKLYLGWRLERLPVRVKPRVREQIIRNISSEAGGMFLSAALFMDQQAESVLQEARGVIRRSHDVSIATFGLDNFYKDILQQIEGKKVAGKPSGKLILSLLVCSKRPLTLPEMQHALAVQETRLPWDYILDEDDLPKVDDILSACLGLLAIDPITRMLNFVHHTARRYFENWWTSPTSYANLRIAGLCVRYLSLPNFKSGVCGTDEEYERRLARYPFYEYSAKNWGHHLWVKCYKGILGVILLEDPVIVSVCLQGLFSEPGTPGYSQRYPTATGMHLAAYFGLDHLYDYLINQGQQLLCKDSNGHTPLWWALEWEKYRVVRFLKDKDNITLRQLMKAGRKDLVRRLLEGGYDVNSLDFFRRTPLHNAISSGTQDLLIDFVEAGADVSVRDPDGVTPLRLAVQLGRLNLIDILLEYGASPEDVSLPEWRKLYQRQRSDVAVLTAKDDIGLSLHFITSKEDLTEESHGSGRLKHYILHGSCVPWYEITSIPEVNVAQFEMATHISRHEDETEFQYAIFSYMPDRHKPTDPNQYHDQVGVTWKVKWRTDEANAEYWQSSDYYSTLPYVWMPNGGVDLLLQFLRYLKQRWIQLTESEKISLEAFRRKVFRGKGKTRHLLDELLRDADTCNHLRVVLQDHVQKLKEIENEYCRRHEGDEAMEQLHDATDDLLRDISQRIDSLDKACQDLIQIEFNLVLINEARLSTSTAMSMKRLSWITFIFLPATFTSTVFGMNINLLEDNPSWWWYLPLLGAILALTLVGWLLFKYNPKAEASVDRKIEAVFGSGRFKKKIKGIV